METLFVLPFDKEDLDCVSDLVRKNDSFVALVDGDLYAIHQYHHPSPLGNFTAILDRNVYTRILAVLRRQPIAPHAIDDHRWAAAVLAFCQIAEITFQYGSSLQEYASIKGGEAAVADIKSFHRADNCNPKAWIDFAVGRSSLLDTSSIEDLPDPTDLPSVNDFEAPIYEFRVNYIFALKIFALSFDKAPPEKVMMTFLTWMKDEFVIGAGATHFANLLLSPGRIKGMLKKRTIRDAQNIAWDFATLQNWRRCALAGAQRSEPAILITRDKVLKFMANRLVASDFEEYRNLLTEPWRSVPAKGEQIFAHYCSVYQEVEATSDKREKPSDARLEALTHDLEREIVELKAGELTREEIACSDGRAGGFRRTV